MTADTKRLWMPVAALGLSAFVSLLVGEVALRIYNPMHIPLRAYDISLPVNQTFVRRIDGADGPDAVTIVRYNSLGLRGPERPKNFDDVTSIITVGGSTTACVGLSEEHAWPHLVFERLASPSDRIWLNNAGLDGHSTFGHMMLMRQVLSKLKPDYLLFLVGVNDVGRTDLNGYDRDVDPFQSDGTARFVRHSELLSTAQVIWRSLRAYDKGLVVGGSINFATMGRRTDTPAAAKRLLDDHRKRMLPMYESRLRTLLRQSRDAGIIPVFATQPAFYGEGIDPSTGREIGDMDVSGMSAALKWKELELYNDSTRRVAKEQNAPLIDLARTIPKDSRLYSDYIHFSRAGSHEVAAAVAADLTKILAANQARP